MIMFCDRVRVGRCLRAGVVLSLVMAAAGCGGARYPVSGRVLLNGKPLQGKEGVVVLKPDASKGNNGSASAVGVLEKDGSFNILTNGQPGARPGWYKVMISANEPGANPNEGSRRVVNAVYETEATTPLTIEVVANASEGSYDLQLSP
jgi:hypothetical protein